MTSTQWAKRSLHTSTAVQNLNGTLSYPSPANPAVPPIRPTGAPATWRMLLLPSPVAAAAHRSTTSHGFELVRQDSADSALRQPWFVRGWSVDVGWHRGLAEVIDAPPAPQSTLAGSAQPTAPRPRQMPHNTDAESNTRLGSLLAEAAHDIRSPIAAAQQILSAVANRARSGEVLTRGEVELLDVANMRLTQASRWAEGVLVDRSLTHGQPVNIRSRFYPHQWQVTLRPLLDSIAAQRRVRLSWVGWDRSLPRLYLDANHLSRAVLNLVTNAIEASQPGQHVCIRVAWQTNVTQRLVIAIEDQATGLDVRLLRRINSTAPWPTNSGGESAGIGLRTAKALVQGMGGALSAQRAADRGTLIRMTLPVDNHQSLIRSWLLHNVSQADPASLREAQTIQVHAIRCAGIDTELVDSQLQQAASPREFVYRVGRDRWLWIALVRSRKADNQETALQATLRRLRDMGRQRVQASCMEQLVYSVRGLSLGRLHSASDQRCRLPNLTRTIAERIGELVGHRVLPVDELDSRSQAIIIRSPDRGIRRIRQDQPQSRRPHIGHSRGPAETSLPQPGAAKASESAAHVISEAAQQWRTMQSKLQVIQPKVNSSTTASPRT